MTRDRPTRASDDTVTPLLRAWQNGDPEAADRLIPLVYAELRSLAGRHMRAERDGHTLQPTALVNEAFVRLVDQRSTEWQGRAHFLAIGSRIMRRILVDHSRRRSAGKRDGGIQITLGDSLSAEQPTALDLLVVDDALSRLAAIDERKARIVELRFFGGLENAAVAEVLGISTATVKRDWVLAKAWLQRELDD